MIGATPEGSYAAQQGSKDVIVAVIDTGIDGSHPDIAPNFNEGAEPQLDDGYARTSTAPCVSDPDHSCSDPANVDEDGHGTHVAGTIAAPINNFGMAGVAPNVTLVNDRAGQDSGFFFLWETVNALKYAGDIGADVANMSFYTDPWQYNCPGAHPAVDPETGQPTDTPAEVAEQEEVAQRDPGCRRLRDRARRDAGRGRRQLPQQPGHDCAGSSTTRARTTLEGNEKRRALSQTGAATCRTRRTASSP